MTTSKRTPAVKKTANNGNASPGPKRGSTDVAKDPRKIGQGKPGPGRPRGALNKATRTVRELAADHGPAAVATLAELMSDEEQPGIVRVAAARDLLDRAYGKPTQYVELDAAVESTTMSREEADQLYARAMASAAAQKAQMIERRKRLEAEDARERGVPHE